MSSVGIRAVLDTNILISALFWAGVPHRVLSAGLKGRYTILTSPQLLEEIFLSLADKFKFPVEDTREFLEVITAHAEIVIPHIHLQVIKRDPSDDKVIECAVAGGADYIVSGDKDLLTIKQYHKIKIVRALQFIPFVSQ